MFSKRIPAIFPAFIVICSIFFLIAGCSSKKKEVKPVIETDTQQAVKLPSTTVMTVDNISLLKPTVYWQELMSEGSDFYTPEDIAESNVLLDQYINDLAVAKDTAAIWKAVEVVVTGFDKLSLRSDFIETGEREDLAEFIQEAAELYGLRYDGDITEKWRMEW
jgi:hypothetical protein